MRKILLIGASNGASIRPGQFLAPPMGIHRIASYLRLYDYDARVYDTNLDGVAGLYELVMAEQFDLIGFSPLDGTWERDRRIIDTVKIFSPDSVLIAGGQSAAFRPEIVFSESPIDIIVQGWGEFALKKILDIYKPEQPLAEQFSSIPGLYVGSSDTQTEYCQAYTLDEFRHISLNFDFASVPYERYWEFMAGIYDDEQLYIMRNSSMIKTVRMITTSHCNSGCNFCSSTNFLDQATGQRQKVLRLSSEDIIELMKKAIQAHPGVDAFYFNDDNFMTSKRRIYDLADLIERELGDRKLRFFGLSRVDNVDQSVLKRMRDVGFELIIYGVESFSDNILRDMNKQVSALVSRQAIERTLKAGITPFINLILFYPTTAIPDIVESIDTTVDFMERGARVAVNNYVWPLAGASMAKKYDHAGRAITPINDDVRILASQSQRLHRVILSEMKEKYIIGDSITLPVDSLALFLAIYRLLGKPTGKIEHLMDTLCERQKLAS